MSVATLERKKKNKPTCTNHLDLGFQVLRISSTEILLEDGNVKAKNWFSGEACLSLEESRQLLHQEVFWKGYFILKSVKTD